jgi:hypothetical protein
MQSYQWPADFSQADLDTAPAWIKDAVAAREIRVVDSYATVYTPTDNVTAKPGDFIVAGADNSLHVASAALYAVLKGKPEPDAPLVAQAVDMVASLGAPPFSSAVLARSARAREAQAQYDARVKTDPKPDPHNAQVEGANTPE